MRQQRVKYLGQLSNLKTINAGVPQGTKLGPILFIVMINDACNDVNLPIYKYVDDLTIVESRKVTSQSKLQNAITDLYQWSAKNNMTLNPSKCFSMVITFMKNCDEQTSMFIGDKELIYVHQTKVLGIILQSNLKWDSHVSDLTKRCNRKLFMFRCLKKYGLPVDDLLLIYKGYIRSILDYGVPVFNGNLTKTHVYILERIQKRACKIILGRQYENYEAALETCNLCSLEARRKQLCIDFANALVKHPQFKECLPLRQQSTYSLRSQSKFKQYQCKTKRFQCSSLPYFINLLNKM